MLRYSLVKQTDLVVKHIYVQGFIMISYLSFRDGTLPGGKISFVLKDKKCKILKKNVECSVFKLGRRLI